MNTVAEHIRLDAIDACSGEALCQQLQEIVDDRRLTAVFQPILDMHQATVVGFEGLIRGPVGSVLHSPVELFSVARNCGMVSEVEYLSRRIVLESFVRLDFPGKLFLNISPDVLLEQNSPHSLPLTPAPRGGGRRPSHLLCRCYFISALHLG